MDPERELETSLARDLIAGEEGGFDRFVDHFRTRIFQYSWMMCGHREDAEEVAQEALLKVFENFQQLREPERVRPWVFRIAKNACLTKRRRSVFAPSVSAELSLDELMPAKEQREGKVQLQLADWSAAQPDELAMRGELRVALDAAIRELPDLYRPVMLLRDVEGLSTQETAQILDIQEDAVKTRLHRARLAVRQKLDRTLAGGSRREVTHV